MANNNSALKRVRATAKKATANLNRKSAMKTAIKKCKTAIETGSQEMTNIFKNTASTVDKAAAKGIIHKNAAARRKSKLARALNKAKA